MHPVSSELHKVLSTTFFCLKSYIGNICATSTTEKSSNSDYFYYWLIHFFQINNQVIFYCLSCIKFMRPVLDAQSGCT